MIENITRRAMVAVLPSALAAAEHTVHQKTRPLPRASEFVRFSDPTTEATVVRLTNPAAMSLLPAPRNRFMPDHGRFLIFSSDRPGKLAPFLLDLHTGVPRQLGQTPGLAPRSLCLDNRGRLLYFVDDHKLQEIALSNRRMRTVAENVSGFALGKSPSDLLAIRNGKLEQIETGTVLSDNAATPLLLRPGQRGCVFTRPGATGGREFWYVSLPKAPASKPVLLASGAITNPIWSPDGSSLLFLRQVKAGSAIVSEIHEVLPESQTERLVARTSQFAAFAPNADASVFVGASGSKAQPNVLLLLRSVQREFTLCEHGARNAAAVSPIFSADSKRVFFQSDREGHSALYTISVEKIVEPTGPS